MAENEELEVRPPSEDAPPKAQPPEEAAPPSAQDEIDAILAKAGEKLSTELLGQAKPFELQQLAADTAHADAVGIDLLQDVDLDVKVVLGRNHMYVEDILKLHPGSVIELDKLAGDPLDILVNDRLVARGEVLVLNDNFCIRITEIVDPSVVQSDA